MRVWERRNAIFLTHLPAYPTTRLPCPPLLSSPLTRGKLKRWELMINLVL